jgi:hypothetical protein
MSPMEQQALNAYANEIAYQRQIAQWAFRAVKEATEAHALAVRRIHELVAGQPDPLPEAVTAATRPITLEMVKAGVRGLMALQTMLTSAGIVSWIFWPNPRKFGTETEEHRQTRADRGEVLRAMFEVPEDSPLHVIPKGAEDVRGGLLHVDEIFDDYVARFPGKSIDSFAIGTVEPSSGWDPSRIVRVLDDATWVARIGDRQINLTKLDAELTRVASRIRADVKVIPVEIPRTGEGGSGAFSVMGGGEPEASATLPRHP